MSNFLYETTGRTATWWMAAVQEAVKNASKPSDDPDHDTTDGVKFLSTVSELVLKSMPPDTDNGVPYDGNMRAAAIMSIVLGLWYARLGYAKAHDPNRPVSLRIRAYKRWQFWITSFLTTILDESEDATYFPGQKWDFPFSHDAANGGFV